MNKVTQEKVKAALDRTWFTIEETENNILLDTRDHGDVGSETPGKEDIAEGKRIFKRLRKAFPASKYIMEFEVVDEWVTVAVRKEPLTAAERERRSLKAKADKINGKAEAVLSALNATLTANDPKVGNPLYFRVSDRHFGCGKPNYVAVLTAKFGERLLYTEHQGAKFVFRDAREATAKLGELTSEIEDFGLTFVRSVVSGPTEQHTYNYPPPRNVIERSGDVRFEFELK